MARSSRSIIAPTTAVIFLMLLGTVIGGGDIHVASHREDINIVSPECSAEGGSDTCSNTKPVQCALYLAPSTLPKANIGLFSGVDIPAETLANDFLGGSFPGHLHEEDPPLWEDLYIPVVDHFKGLPYRGQQLFPSWLAYIWPREPGAFFDESLHEPYPYVHRRLWAFDEGFNGADEIEFYSEVWDDDTPEDEDWDHLKVSAFVPGILSLVNSHSQLSNLVMTYDNMKKDDARAGAFTPHHGVTFETMDAVKSGAELLLHYGENWHTLNDEKIKGIKYSGSSKLTRKKQGFVEGLDKKWDIMEEDAIGVLPWEIPTEKGKRDRLATKKAIEPADLPEGVRPYSDYRYNNYHPLEQEDDDEVIDDEEVVEDGSDQIPPQDSVRPITWLEQNGVCLSSGRLRINESKIPGAGRGVFSTTNINAGEVILVSPLIAMRRNDFRIYRTDPSKKRVKDRIDHSTVVGEELLLNYAFGHPDSPMLLVPTAPFANFINHASPRETKSLQPNVQIRWPESNSNAAKLFDWVFHNHGHRYTKFNENDSTLEHNPWLKMHPIDVMERSGKLAIEYEAIRDIKRNEEILIDYGSLWDEAWKKYKDQLSNTFRHFIQVPPNFYPTNWLNVSDTYEIAEIKDLKNKPLEVGKVMPLTWAHNGKPLSSKYGYIVGLPKGFSNNLLHYAEKEGIIQLYRRLLTEQEGYTLESDSFDLFHPHDLVTNGTKELEFFAHRYHSSAWSFNMHYVAPWNELARKSLLAALGNAGLDYAVRGIGERFGYNNLTCGLNFFMGMSHCDNSKMHTDSYATGDKAWNILFPLITVEGTEPELDIMAEDMNTMVGVNYIKDVAYVIGDFGYHKTRPSGYHDPESSDDDIDIQNVPIRIVFNSYCYQVDESNIAMMRFMYDLNDPHPFADQFIDLPMREIHWDKSGMTSLKNPGKG